MAIGVLYWLLTFHSTYSSPFRFVFNSIQYVKCYSSIWLDIVWLIKFAGAAIVFVQIQLKNLEIWTKLARVLFRLMSSIQLTFTISFIYIFILNSDQFDLWSCTSKTCSVPSNQFQTSIRACVGLKSLFFCHSRKKSQMKMVHLSPKKNCRTPRIPKWFWLSKLGTVEMKIKFKAKHGWGNSRTDQQKWHHKLFIKYSCLIWKKKPKRKKKKREKDSTERTQAW